MTTGTETLNPTPRETEADFFRTAVPNDGLKPPVITRYDMI